MKAFHPMYESLLRQSQQYVREHAIHQVLDNQRPDHGAWITTKYGFASADHTATADHLTRILYLLFADDSPGAGDPDLIERVIAAIGFIQRSRRPSGLIDLPKVDIDSPPDTAFVVQLLCPVLELVRERAARGDTEAGRVAERLAPLARSLAEAVVGRGFRTPNHRWVVCSALAVAMTSFPDLDARPYVDSILAETIDINADGDYSERSSSIYNGVCNRAMRLLADHLNKPELLDHVRANLDLTLHMLHADGSVVTSGSRRQDAGIRNPPTALFDSFLDMAFRDDNGQYLTAAQALLDQPGEDQRVWWLHPYIDRPEYRERDVAPRPLPERYTRLFPASRVWRARDRQLSVTAVAGHTDALGIRFGDLELSIGFHGCYYHSGRFAADHITELEDGVRLIHDGACRREPGWDLPLGRPVRFDEPMEFYRLADEGGRERWTLPRLSMAIELRQTEGGLDFSFLTTQGPDRIPFAVTLKATGCDEWVTEEQAVALRGGETIVVGAQGGTFHNGRDAIEIGPGMADLHRTGLPFGSPAQSEVHAVIPLFSPVSFKLPIRFGQWSWATRSVHSTLDVSQPQAPQAVGQP